MSALLADTGQTGQLTCFMAYDVLGVNCSGATVLKLTDAFKRASGVKIARKYVPRRDGDPELELALRAKGRHAEADMVRNILPEGVKCIFMRQPGQLGLGHAVLCAERAVGDEPFAVILADDFLTYEGDGVTVCLVRAFERTGKVQLSVMGVNGPNISKYGVATPGSAPGSVSGLVEKPPYKAEPSNLASSWRYVLGPDIFDVLRGQPTGAGGETQFADAINIVAKRGGVEAISLDGQRFDCGSINKYRRPSRTWLRREIKWNLDKLAAGAKG